MTNSIPVPTQRTVIRPSRGMVHLGLAEAWQYRELFQFLVWRDIKVRYKQTVLGVLWAVIQPVVTMVVFTIFFGRLAGMPSDGLPYPVFAFCGLLPWQLFSRALTDSGNSLVGSQNLITKVYFPRLIIPLAAIVAGLVDFALASVVLAGLMIWYGMVPGLPILALPIFLVLALGSALAMGLWLSALNVQFRDVRYAIPFLTQFWMFVTPVAYPASLVPERWRLLLGLNPMTGVVEGFRWALLGRGEPPGALLAVSMAVIAVFIVSSLYYFRRMERSFADVV